jgi:polysaccharide export outer membrane protein
MLNRLLKFGFFLVALAPSLAGAQVQVKESPALFLSPGDVVRITVWGKAEYSGEFPIAMDGSIVHPLYRELGVAGLTPASAEERVRDYLSRFEAAPQIILEPLLRVSVGGEVRQPRIYMLPPETTIADAVAMAGGGTERARLERVRLFRGGKESVVDLTRPETGLAQASIRSGDQLYVARQSSVFRDYIGPVGSVVAAVTTVVRLFIK